MIILPYDVWGAVVIVDRVHGLDVDESALQVLFYAVIALTIGPTILGAIVGGISDRIFGIREGRGVLIGICSGVISTVLAWGVIVISAEPFWFDIDPLSKVWFSLIFTILGAGVAIPIGIAWWRSRSSSDQS